MVIPTHHYELTNAEKNTLRKIARDYIDAVGFRFRPYSQALRASIKDAPMGFNNRTGIWSYWMRVTDYESGTSFMLRVRHEDYKHYVRWIDKDRAKRRYAKRKDPIWPPARRRKLSALAKAQPRDATGKRWVAAAKAAQQ